MKIMRTGLAKGVECKKECSFICKNPALQGKCLTLTFKEVSNERLMNVELRL